MTRKAIITGVILVGLTLASFALVSSYFSSPAKQPIQSQAAPSRPSQIGTSRRTADTAASSTQPATAEQRMYQDLTEAQALLDQLRKAVLAGEWAKANALFEEFNRKTPQFPAPQLNQPEFSPALQDFFTLYRVELARALNEQHTINARFTLNQLFAIVSEQRTRLGTRGLPLEFNRLHFLVREVELWAQLNNEPLLRERLKTLQETWQEVRPVIIARPNGRETASHFDQLIEQLGATATAQTIAALVTECNQDLVKMDELFQQMSAAQPTASPGKPADDD